jgi:asparagine synthase (glutamine-hydrolysing)
VHAIVDGWLANGEDVARLYEEKGERCFDELTGSFAAAIWDAKERKLVLARDAFGTKPLHHASDHGRFLFASEPSGILGELRGRPHVDPISIDDVLAFGWTERRRTGYEEIERLYPGELAVYRSGKLERRPWRVAPRATTPRPGDAQIRALGGRSGPASTPEPRLSCSSRSTRARSS